MCRGSFRRFACRCKYRMVPAYPFASQASSWSACGVGLGSVIPHARNPSAVARAFTTLEASVALMSLSILHLVRVILLGDEPRAQAVGDVRPGPLEQHHQPIAEPDQVE